MFIWVCQFAGIFFSFMFLWQVSLLREIRDAQKQLVKLAAK
jgi:hypothetical protein